MSQHTATAEQLDLPVQVFESGLDRVNLLEMYSSQGCSSCPPAEKWINQFTEEDDLWNSVIPVVFHVDYWDYLGWKDPFSKHAYSERQGQFKQQGLSRSVYTPGFMLNGKEWRGWFKRKGVPAPNASAGNLSVKLEGDTITAQYSRAERDHLLNIAVIGFGLKTYVKRGENSRRTLKQDFVVLDFKQVDLFNGQWISDFDIPDFKAKDFGLVAWITKGNSLVPEQATGSLLTQDLVKHIEGLGD